ncbi:hypothetical protein PybrP1_008875 [[Pythium] brassicae (nom. inval.)]|nr:hypothetical protein PybrP1_008875 [[Pythium] brassicae (nom. inval.)]
MKNPRNAQEIAATPFPEPETSPTSAKGPAPSAIGSATPDYAAAAASTPTCAICRQEIRVGSPVKELCCAHVLHAKCVDQWLRAECHCPVCKTQVLFPPPDTAAPAPDRHPPKVVAVPLNNGTDARRYGVCRDCSQVFYRDPEIVRPDTLAWYRCQRCRDGDILDLLRSSCTVQ